MADDLLNSVTIPSSLDGTAWDTGPGPEEARRQDCLRVVERGSGVATACGACGGRATAEVCRVTRPGQPAVRRWVLRCWRPGWPGRPPCPLVVLEVAEGEADPEWPVAPEEGQDPNGRREPLLVGALAGVRRKRYADRPPAEKRSCAECGEAFQPGTARARYCSPECKGRANKRDWKRTKREAARGPQKEETVSTTSPERTCVVCGKGIVLRKGAPMSGPTAAKTCSPECRREQDRRRNRASSAARKTALLEVTCDECGSSFQPRRHDQRFCAVACRARWARRAGRKGSASLLSPPEPQEQPVPPPAPEPEAGASKPLAGPTRGGGGIPEGGAAPSFSRSETEGEWELVDGMRRPPSTPHHSRAIEERLEGLIDVVESLMRQVADNYQAVGGCLARLERDSHPPVPGLALATEVDSWLALQEARLGDRLTKQSTALQDVDRKLSERLQCLEDTDRHNTLTVQERVRALETARDLTVDNLERLGNALVKEVLPRVAWLEAGREPPHDPPGWTWDGLVAALCDLAPEEVEATLRFAAVVRARQRRVKPPDVVLHYSDTGGGL